MNPLEVGAAHQAMPQGITEYGVQTIEQVQQGTDRPQTNERTTDARHTCDWER